MNPYYTGSSTVSDISDFAELTEEITIKDNNKIVTYTDVDNKYLVFTYDKSYGNLTSIKDENGFENISNWNKTELEVSGENYLVYVTQLPVTIEGSFKYIFSL